jgi:hypothetical protein
MKRECFNDAEPSVFPEIETQQRQNAEQQKRPQPFITGFGCRLSGKTGGNQTEKQVCNH